MTLLVTDTAFTVPAITYSRLRERAALNSGKEGIMPNRIHVAFVAGLLATAAFGIAQTTPIIKEVPMKSTSPASGKQMYSTYCAVCHGMDGKGGGPAAAALKEHPTNLAQLARDNGGKFPDAHIYSVLQFGMETTAHGSKDMPIWGPALRSLDKGSPAPEMQEHQRLANLTNYLKTLQQQ
jgi:mono/diheme cytochrome c family protein